jgi:hypothetical protein
MAIEGVLHDGEVPDIEGKLATIDRYAVSTRRERLRPDPRSLKDGSSIGYWLRFVQRLDPGRVKRVPAVSIVEENEDEVLVKCPCGARPVIERRLGKCASCERWYAYVGDMVYVTYGEMGVPGRIS